LKNFEDMIISEFYSGFESLNPSFNAVSCEYICEYDKKSRLKEISARMYFNQFNIDFAYIVKGLAVGPRSTLECRIWLNKSEKLLYFTPYDLMFMLDPGNFKCYFYTFIESAEKMGLCFNNLAADVKELLPKIAEIAGDPQKVQQAYNSLKANITNHLGKNIFEPDSQLDPETNELVLKSNLQYYYQWVRLRFASKCYSDFLSGDYRKAIRKYSRYKKRLDYEDRLLQFMKSIPDGQKYQAVIPELNTIKQGLKEQTRISEAFIIYISWIVNTIFLFPLFLGLYYLLLYISTRGALYSTGIELYNSMLVLLPTIITSIVPSYFSRKLLYRIFFRKNYRKKLEYDALFNGKSEAKLMKVFAYIIFLASLTVTALLASTGISFYSNRFVDKSNFFDIKGTSYSYDSLDSVWLIKGRYNGFNEWLDNPSYVLVLKDGKTIDLYDFTEHSDSEKKIIPILKKQNIPFFGAKTIEDIKPQYG